MEQFAEFDKNGGRFSKRVEKNCGKRRNCSLRAISPLPTMFSNDSYCRHGKTRTCLGKEKPERKKIIHLLAHGTNKSEPKVLDVVIRFANFI